MQPDPAPSATVLQPSRRTNVDEGVPTAPQAALRLERRLDGKLWLVTGEQNVPVEVVRCFPWTAPGRLLSLRTADGEEAAFVADPAALDAESRRALSAVLVRSGFVLEITRILAVEEDFELRSWRVLTARGPRAFQTPLDAWPRRLDGGGLVLEDVYGDLYRVSHPHALDAQSQKLLWAFVD